MNNTIKNTSKILISKSSKRKRTGSNKMNGFSKSFKLTDIDDSKITKFPENNKNLTADVETYFHKSKYGILEIRAQNESIIGVDFVSTKIDVKDNQKVKNNVIIQCCKELDEYFEKKRTKFDVDIDMRGTSFQLKVWSALLEIPYGKTITYAQLAEMVGNPKASRAVGNANGKNPISIIVPCHRVIASDGTLGGYSSGLDIKRILLKLEQN